LTEQCIVKEINGATAMIDVGTIIHATVGHVEVYGIFMQHDSETIFVHLPEVSWRDKRPFPQWIHPGDAFDVLVIGYNYVNRQIIGSIRRLHPGENPFRELSRLEPGTVLQGKVKRNYGDGEIMVELSNGAWGHMPGHAVQRKLAPGENVEVVISTLKVDEGRAWFEPAQPADRGPSCKVQVQLPQMVS
jgi:ribosomal protein S1